MFHVKHFTVESNLMLHVKHLELDSFPLEGLVELGP